MIHECIESSQVYTVENREGEWYLYLGDIRGGKPILFCPYCGADLLKEEANH